MCEYEIGHMERSFGRKKVGNSIIKNHTGLPPPSSDDREIERELGGVVSVQEMTDSVFWYHTHLVFTMYLVVFLAVETG